MMPPDAIDVTSTADEIVLQPVSWYTLPTAARPGLILHRCSTKVRPTNVEVPATTLATMADKEAMEVDAGSAVVPASEKPKPRFEIKKYNAVALWAWGKFSSPMHSKNLFAASMHSDSVPPFRDAT